MKKKENCYDFDDFINFECQHNDEINYRYLPFKTNYMMFNNLCNLDSDLTVSKLYDKFILLKELYLKMFSQVLEENLQLERYLYG